MIDTRGHDHDADQAEECACGEIVRDQAAHRCKPIGWIEHCDTTALEAGAFTFYDFPQPPECNHRWARAHVFYERNGQRIPMPTDEPVRMCGECGQITLDHQEPA